MDEDDIDFQSLPEGVPTTYFDGNKYWPAPPFGYSYKLCVMAGCRNIVVGTKMGKPAIKCLEHRKIRSDIDIETFEPLLDANTVAQVSDRVIAKSAKEIAMQRSLGAKNITDRRKLAIVSRIEKDPYKAAKLAGILAEGEELEQLIQEALKPDMEDLRSGKQNATAGTITVAAALLAEMILESIFEIPISSGPAALAQLTKAIEPLGGFRKSYTKMEISFLPPTPTSPAR